MKMFYLYTLLLTLISFMVEAQTKPATTSAKPPVQTSQTRPTFSSTSDSLKFAINDFKSSMNNLFGSKKDTIALMVSNVEYDDANLESLKDHLKQIKGAKFIGMQYKAAVARIELSFKGKPTELWDELPADVRKPFKIVEATDNNLMLMNRKQ